MRFRLEPIRYHSPSPLTGGSEDLALLGADQAGPPPVVCDCLLTQGCRGARRGRPWQAVAGRTARVRCALRPRRWKQGRPCWAPGPPCPAPWRPGTARHSGTTLGLAARGAHVSGAPSPYRPCPAPPAPPGSARGPATPAPPRATRRARLRPARSPAPQRAPLNLGPRGPAAVAPWLRGSGAPGLRAATGGQEARGRGLPSGVCFVSPTEMIGERKGKGLRPRGETARLLLGEAQRRVEDRHPAPLVGILRWHPLQLGCDLTPPHPAAPCRQPTRFLLNRLQDANGAAP